MNEKRTNSVSGNNVFSFFFSSRRRHTRFTSDWSSDVCSSDLATVGEWENGFATRTVLNFFYLDGNSIESFVPVNLDRKSVV